MDLTISVVDSKGNELYAATGTDLVQLDGRNRPYREGDRIILEASEENVELEVMLDASLSPSIVYLPSGCLEFPVPFEKRSRAYAEGAFCGRRSWGYARVLDARERGNYRNLALNSHDLEGEVSLYPHASTNSGATDDRYLARNAIDGVFQTCCHAEWPYESWGINGREDAWLQVDFGRPVHACELVLFLRADFPHDAWWERARVTCSDGFDAEVSLGKTGGPQRFDLGGRDTEWLRLSDLKKVDDPSPWPALSQLMVMGRLI